MEDAVPGPDNRFLIQLIGDAYARSEIVPVGPARARLSSEPGAASTTWLVAISKFAIRLATSVTGVVYSYRTPMFMVSRFETFQSSWMKLL